MVTTCPVLSFANWKIRYPCHDYSQDSSFCVQFHQNSKISEKRKHRCWLTYIFSHPPVIGCKISNLISSFQFQSFFLVLQNWYIKIMLLGWLVGFWDGSLCWNFTTTMLIFQHKFSNQSNNADNSACMLKIQQHQYHKLKNCPLFLCS